MTISRMTRLCSFMFKPKFITLVLLVIASVFLLEIVYIKLRIKLEPVTPLTAAITGNVVLLRQLETKGADLNVQYPEHFNWTPLIAAIYHQNTNVISFLLDRGVDVTKRDRTGKTALMWAITFCDTNTVALLLQKAPLAIKEHEYWPVVWSQIQINDCSNQWRALLSEYLTTNNLNADRSVPYGH